MVDGLYQSIVCFFLPYLLFQPATFNTESGQNVNDYQRMGVYIANATVVVANLYILMNTYRWDWFFTLITTISILLIWTWTGIYSSFTAGFTFYKAGAEAYGSLSFWALTMMVIVIALLPRFAAKSFQKMFMPRDIDLIREQIRQGKFDYLKKVDADNSNGLSPAREKGTDSTSSSEISKASGAQRLTHKLSGNRVPTEDERPIYPPSIAATATTRNARSHNGSDGTDYTGHRSSIERTLPAGAQATWRPSEDFGHSPIDFSRPPMIAGGFESPMTRPSFERPPRPSFDRLRASMDFERTRPSFESSHDFTSAAYLSRVESSHTPVGTPAAREERKDIGFAL
jgi:phospholipid-translocating ATPase